MRRLGSPIDGTWNGLTISQSLWHAGTNTLDNFPAHSGDLPRPRWIKIAAMRISCLPLDLTFTAIYGMIPEDPPIMRAPKDSANSSSTKKKTASARCTGSSRAKKTSLKFLSITANENEPDYLDLEISDFLNIFHFSRPIACPVSAKIALQLGAVEWVRSVHNHLPDYGGHAAEANTSYFVFHVTLFSIKGFLCTEVSMESGRCKGRPSIFRSQTNCH